MPVELDIKLPQIEAIRCDLLDSCDVLLNVLRLDQIHPCIHGNKWYKLKRNLELFQRQGTTRVLSFGGAWSNHLYALSAAGRYFALETIGLVRGEICQPLNPVLAFAEKQGMKLFPISRSQYRHKHEERFIAQLRSRFGEFQLLPEGGSNLLAVQGCEEIADAIHWQAMERPRVVALCCGTGATMAGVISGINAQQQENPPQVLGFSVLKAQGYLQAEVQRWLSTNQCLPRVSWQVEENYHCGGYARSNARLKAFLAGFAGFSQLPLEGVYTGKLMLGIFDMIEQGKIPPGSEILAIHTGGIYGPQEIP